MNNKTLNILIGALVFVLVGGGAYIMTSGAQFKPADNAGGAADAAVRAIESDVVSDVVQENKIAPDNLIDSNSSKGAVLGSAVKKGEQINEQKIISTMDKQGVKVEVLHVGEGDVVSKSGQLVAVHYIGRFTDGKVFDTSLKQGDKSEPFIFKLGAGMVIRGWDIGVEGMKVGEARRLTIPSDLAYGEKGAPGAIPPNSTLVFDVQLMGVQ